MVNTRSEAQGATLESLQETIQNMQTTMNTMMTEITRLKNGEGTSNSRGSQVNGGQYGRLSKVEFPRFNGDDVKGWVYRCKQFFKIDGVMEDKKVELASMHLYDKALVWHQSYVKRFGEETPWEMYEEEVIKRFGALYDDPIVDLKNLKQDGSVQHYQEEFESFLSRVELNEVYAVSLFIGGLKKEIGMPIRMFGLKTLHEVFAMAKMQEATNAALKPRYNSLLPTPKFVPQNNFVNRTATVPQKTANNGGNQFVPRNGVNRPYRLTQKELEEKRAKNQCFYCDQRYTPGHKCSGQLNCLEVVIDHDDHKENFEEEDVNQEEEEVNDGQGYEFIEQCPQISLNALSGLNSYQTMRFKVMVGKQVVHTLADSGSTHNFLDVQTAKRLGCKLRSTSPLKVSVANGQEIFSTYECLNFKWSINGVQFETDVMLLPLGGCEMVLGVQWLSTLDEIRWNFRTLVMKFEYNGKQVVLRGTQNTSLHWMQGKKAQKETESKQAELYSMMLCVYPVSCNQMEVTKEIDPVVDTVVSKFEDVFVVPKELPPQRSHDHKIPLYAKHSTH